MPTEYQRNPLEQLGYSGWNQYAIFKHHLRMPVEYLKIIMKNNRHDLTDVPVVLPKYLEKIHEHWWSKMNKEASRETKVFATRGVPPLYLGVTRPPVSKADVSKYVQRVLEVPLMFAAAGKVLYLQSEFETEALLAASQIISAVIKERLAAYMLDFPTYLDEIKTWQDSYKLGELRKAQVGCIYMIGKEYSTEFTQAHLETLITQRSLENKVTLLCSHLAPVDFKKRYGIEVPGTVLKFEDEKITKTIAALLKELEHGA